MSVVPSWRRCGVSRVGSGCFVLASPERLPDRAVPRVSDSAESSASAVRVCLETAGCVSLDSDSGLSSVCMDSSLVARSSVFSGETFLFTKIGHWGGALFLIVCDFSLIYLKLLNPSWEHLKK